MYDVGYKLKVIAYAEEHRNIAAEHYFDPLPTEKTICNWWASKEELKIWGRLNVQIEDWMQNGQN